MICLTTPVECKQSCCKQRLSILWWIPTPDTVLHITLMLLNTYAWIRYKAQMKMSHPLLEFLSFKHCVASFQSHIKLWYSYSIHYRPGTEPKEQSIQAFLDCLSTFICFLKSSCHFKVVIWFWLAVDLHILSGFQAFSRCLTITWKHRSACFRLSNPNDIRSIAPFLDLSFLINPFLPGFALTLDEFLADLKKIAWSQTEVA